MVSVTSAAIGKATLLTQAYWNVYNMINDRTKVIDPHPEGISGKRKFVYSREPDVAGQKFKGYPFVICNPLKVKFGPRRLSMTIAPTDWETMIEVRSADTFRSEETGINPKGVGLTWLDQISDDVLETFNSKTNRETLHTYGMIFANLDVGTTDTITTDNEVVYIREIMLSFRNAGLTVN